MLLALSMSLGAAPAPHLPIGVSVAPAAEEPPLPLATVAHAVEEPPLPPAAVALTAEESPLPPAVEAPVAAAGAPQAALERPLAPQAAKEMPLPPAASPAADLGANAPSLGKGGSSRHIGFEAIRRSVYFGFYVCVSTCKLASSMVSRTQRSAQWQVWARPGWSMEFAMVRLAVRCWSVELSRV